jgi:lipid-binding SYLF domain-containing protein
MDDSRWGRVLVAGLVLTLALATFPVTAHEDEDEQSWDQAKIEAKQSVINAMARETLDIVLTNRAEAKALFEKSYGYAVFDNTKVTLGLSGGGGRGVAVVRSTGQKTYMKMGTGGLALGLGVKKYQVVFLFETEARFRQFVDNGWQADAGASASFGHNATGSQVNFVNGMSVYQITEKGVSLEADIAGTKYWKDKKLNG